MNKITWETPRPVAEALTTQETMRAVVVHHYGPPTMLQLETMARPAITSKQVLIRVHAAGVNPIDYRIRQGQLRFILPAGRPLVLGYDVSGQLAEIGTEVSRRSFAIGDDVFSFLSKRHGGGYAEYVAVDADAVISKPQKLTHVESAAVPLACLTAPPIAAEAWEIEGRSRRPDQWRFRRSRTLCRSTWGRVPGKCRRCLQR